MATDNSGGDNQVANFATMKLNRQDFGNDFVWGAATSAYQVEGAWRVGGKGLSNWDVFAMRTPGKIAGGTNGCVAIDQYHMYHDDVKLMKRMGLDAYRFSIAWTRILPGGRVSAGINQEGIKYYNDLINALLAEGIEPYATLFHWDVPQCLEDEYGGFLSNRILKDFVEFAEVCFWEFGDRVKHWITLNEPWTFTVHGYVYGVFPPGRGATSSQPLTTASAPLPRTPPPSRVLRSAISEGDPGTEPYIVAHNMLVSHALVVDLYRRKFQAQQGGKIGITNVSMWFTPLVSDNPDDQAAASRAVDFMWGWFTAPVATGDYPPIMKSLVGDRLTPFTEQEQKLLQGSYDFLGLNYYTTRYASNQPPLLGPTKYSYLTDQRVLQSAYDVNGKPIGPKGGSDWMYVVPYGIYELLKHTKEAYNVSLIYITENGYDEVNDTSTPPPKACEDPDRISYYHEHLTNIKQAMDEGVNVKAYFMWSLFDNYEWAEGYTVRFGVVYVDYVNGYLTRIPKTSALWWTNFLRKPNLLQGSAKREIQETQDGKKSSKRLRSST